MPPLGRMTTPERFWMKVAISDPQSCWFWRGAQLGKRAYGSFIESDGRRVAAHRYVYELAIGPIPDGLFVCHSCDERLCVNPRHLFLGTDLDNKRDMWAKGRIPHGDRHWNSRLTDEMVAEIRTSTERNCDLALRFGVARATISNARRGITRSRLSVPALPKSRGWTRRSVPLQETA